ncbi:hypothetical protein E1B28_012909 [Marasmius oreades]|uniref:DUF6534 domain-containing protein n=1 Tax=Marasmius oreades TaxID=181124 RepID=A0A9P7RSK3_9AGAR|nr:uncharacterized protein E1B28_012909 [Marasmius oreades]KAG7088964.1 hypothetical protein E1B28_012909 [Marasmius oreades]
MPSSISLDEAIVMLSETLILTSLFHWGLFGILTVQMFLYHKSFSRDKLAIRVVFYSIYIMEALQTVWVARKVYLFCGSGSRNASYDLLESMIRVDWGDEAIIVKTGIVGLLCQCFSAWRIWVLSRSKVMTISVVILSLLSAAATAAFAGSAYIIEFLVSIDSNSLLTRDITTILWTASSALCDTIIVIFMGLILKRSKVKVQQGTRTLITKILWLTVTTGALTALMALFALILLVAPIGAVGAWLPAAMLIGKVEANSYLAVLNSRIRLGSSGDDTHKPYSAFAVASAGFEVELGNSVSESRHSVQVHVQQRVEVSLPVLPPSFREGSAIAMDDTNNTQAIEV